MLASAVGLVAALLSGVVAFWFDRPNSAELDPLIVAVAQRAEMQRVQLKIDALSDRVRSSYSNKQGPVTDAEASEIRKSLADVSGRMKRLEDAISADPKRALEVPLLRRDLENMEKSQAQAINSIKQIVDSVYDLTKWVLGGTVFSVIAIAFSNFLSNKRSVDGPES